MSFREVHGQDRVVFVRDPAGQTELVTSYPFFAFNRPSALSNQSFLKPLGIVRARRARPRPDPLADRGARAAPLRQAARLPAGGAPAATLDAPRSCVLDVVLAATYGAIVISGLQNIDLLSDKMDPWLRVMQVLAFLALVGGDRGALERRALLGEPAPRGLEQARRDA